MVGGVPTAAGACEGGEGRRRRWARRRSGGRSMQRERWRSAEYDLALKKAAL